MLFRTLVAIPAQVELGEYGDVQKKLRVVLREEIYEAPAQINRTVKSGYWDYPIESIDGSDILKFVRFFDWEKPRKWIIGLWKRLSKHGRPIQKPARKEFSSTGCM